MFNYVHLLFWVQARSLDFEYCNELLHHHVPSKEWATSGRSPPHFEAASSREQPRRDIVTSPYLSPFGPQSEKSKHHTLFFCLRVFELSVIYYDHYVKLELLLFTPQSLSLRFHNLHV